MMLRRMWEPCAVFRYMAEVLPLAGMPLTGLKWPGGERRRIMKTVTSQARRDEEVKDLGRWTSFSLSEIVLCKEGG